MLKGLIKASAAATGVLGAVCYATFHQVMARDASLADTAAKIFNKFNPPDENVKLLNDDDERLVWYNAQNFEEFTMVNSRNQKLRGYLIKSEKPSDIYVFCSHGYRSRGKAEFRFMSKYYHDKGYNLFYVDHQAAGLSEGKYIGFGYYEYQDALMWLDFMKKQFGEDISIILHGVSMGSATVLMMSGAESLPSNVKFTVADCGYTSAYDEFENTISFLGKAEYAILYGADFFNKLISGYHFKDASPISAVEKAKVPILFIHGKKDDFVPTRMGNELFDACTSEKDLLLVEGAAHAESYRANPEAYEAKIDEFIEKYLK